MALAITARFPLGTYTGHSPSGNAERLPELARLHSALIQASARGPLGTGDPTEPHSVEAREALEWLETHPPDALSLPSTEPLNPGGERLAYRKEGVFLKEGKAVNDKVTGRALSDGTCVLGPIQWIWEDGPEPQVAETLDALCADVPFLGESSSPVQIDVGEPGAATHTRDDGTGIMAPFGAVQQQVPAPGRLQELDDAHAGIAVTPKFPTASADKHSTSARPYTPPPPRTRLRTAVFVPVDAKAVRAPWSLVLAVPVSSGGSIPDEHLVQVCVAMHRALVSRLGRDASPLITGRYPRGAAQPANRIALHLLPGDAPASPFDDGRDRMLVLVPQDASAEDLAQLDQALSSVERVTTAEHQLHLAHSEMETFDGDDFWEPPAPGFHRTWEASPAIVPERHLSSLSWVRDLDAAAAWSLGNVLRDFVPGIGERDARARWDLAVAHGVQFRCRALRSLTPRSFVHRTGQAPSSGRGKRQGIPAHPFRAELDMGDLLSPRSILALGQSRHLGCGLLLPVDRPIPTAAQEIR